MKLLKIDAWKMPLSKIQLLFLDTSLAILGLGFTSYFLYTWLFLPSWVHNEFINTAPGYLLKAGQNIFSNSFEYIFNLKIGEGGFYRPRILSFLIQYLDTNFSFQLYKAYPNLGIKLPSYVLSILATVASFVWFWRSLFPKRSYGVALCGGASLLYYDVYMNTSFMVLRGGKFLVAATGIFCITIFIRRHQRDFSLNQLDSCISISFLMFLLATLDEQIAALNLVMALTALFVGLIEKRVNQAAVIFALATVIYCIYYFFLGRMLFDKFTPGGIMAASHHHQLSDIFRVNPVVVFNAIEMILSNFILMGISSIVFLGVFLTSISKAFQKSNLEKGSPTQYFILGGLLVAFPILLTAVMVASHPPMYTIHELWYVFYLPLPIYVLSFAVPYSVYMSDSETEMPKFLLTIAFIIICVSGIYKMNNRYHVSCTSVSKVLNSSTCGVNPVPVFKVNN